MPRLGTGWKEAGFDTSPPPRGPSRKAWMEMYVGRAYARLAGLEGKLTPVVHHRLKQWMLDPEWLRSSELRDG